MITIKIEILHLQKKSKFFELKEVNKQEAFEEVLVVSLKEMERINLHFNGPFVILYDDIWKKLPEKILLFKKSESDAIYQLGIKSRCRNHFFEIANIHLSPSQKNQFMQDYIIGYGKEIHDLIDGTEEEDY